MDEWAGMPAFDQEDLSGWKAIVVRFRGPDDYAAFAEAIGQKLTPKTRGIWYPEAPIDRLADKRYSTDEPT